jgi:hypothetical protein
MLCSSNKISEYSENLHNYILEVLNSYYYSYLQALCFNFGNVKMMFLRDGCGNEQ